MWNRRKQAILEQLYGHPILSLLDQLSHPSPMLPSIIVLRQQGAPQEQPDLSADSMAASGSKSGLSWKGSNLPRMWRSTWGDLLPMCQNIFADFGYGASWPGACGICAGGGMLFATLLQVACQSWHMNKIGYVTFSAEKDSILSSFWTLWWDLHMEEMSLICLYVFFNILHLTSVRENMKIFSHQPWSLTILAGTNESCRPSVSAVHRYSLTIPHYLQFRH